MSYLAYTDLLRAAVAYHQDQLRQDAEEARTARGLRRFRRRKGSHLRPAESLLSAARATSAAQTREAAREAQPVEVEV